MSPSHRLFYCPKGHSIVLLCTTLLICTLVNISEAYQIMNETGAMKYLERFGYASEEDMADGMGMEKAKPMLMAFQKMCHINLTGELDKKTMEMMNAPRCGNMDMIKVPKNESFLTSNRLKRYTIHESGSRWKKREVTYKIGMYSSKMEKHVKNEDVLKAIAHAFRLWSEVTNLDFIHTPKASSVDIELSFTTRDHPQDMFPFDGPGSTLAHAFGPGPGIGGDVHFEDEEDWRLGSHKGSDVLYVAVHEIGHALGLSHSSVKGSIMEAFYGGYRPVLNLHPDDIEGIQKLYGKRETAPPPPTPRVFVPPPPPRPTQWTFVPATPLPPRVTPRFPPITTQSPFFTSKPFIPRQTFAPTRRTHKFPDSRPSICEDSKVDAITTLNETIYVFKGLYVYQIYNNGEGVKPGWPNHINTVFYGLEGDLDAAATRENGKTYFFKGKKYWRFTGLTMDRGYPKEISVHFPGIPSYVESAFVYRGLFYFTKGDKFFTFDPRTRPHVDPKYPLPIQVWDLPDKVSRLDAAFIAPAPNGNIYLFENDFYYKLDWRNFQLVKDIRTPYPRPSDLHWFGCPQTRRRNKKEHFWINDEPEDFSVDEGNYRENFYYY